MQAFWMALLVKAIKALAGAVVWDAALAAVTDLLDVRMTSEAKRIQVQDDLRRAFKDVPECLLNLVIEAAVTKAKTMSK